VINPYIIQIRLAGRIKRDIVNLVKCVNAKFGVNMHNIVPHMTIVGQFNTEHEKQLIRDFEMVCRKAQSVKYKINGIDLFSKSGVVYLDVAESEELEKFRMSLCNQLKQHCRLRYCDLNKPFKFHTTIATRLDGDVLPEIIKYIYSCKPLIYDLYISKVALLKHGKVLCEYDFNLGRLIGKLEKINPAKDSDFPLYQDNTIIRSKPRIFFASDLHLNDQYIMNQCHRPFSSLDVMNRTFVYNWNLDIASNDKVYYLGDLCNENASEEEVKYWLSQLNGNIEFIKGNNDVFCPDKWNMEYEINAYGKRFFLIHDPDHIPDDVIEDTNMWTIHGHKQNRQLDKYPFINKKTRTINVSLDLTNYRPIALEEIINAMNAAPKPGESELMAMPKEDKTQLFREQIDITKRLYV
jgi:calcineurin-like phosphoesterase family protein/2'-5' RNA ligase